MIYTAVLLNLLFFYAQPTSAQCPTPTSIGTPTIVNASCPGNGKVTVSTMTPTATSIAPDYYQYALQDTLGNVVLPWQASNQLSNIYAGTYNVVVRRVCTSGFSTPLTRRVVITSTEVMSAISSVTLNRQDHGCNNGRFTVAATGTAPLRYALVPSLTTSEPVTTYVRTPRSANVFDSLTAGTYYVRVYNACNNAVTQAITVPAFNRSLVQVNSPTFAPAGCDSLWFQFYVNNHVQLSNSRDTQIVRAWVTWPNGTTDTIKLASTSAAGTSTYLSLNASLSKLDPAYNPALSFWQNLANFPYTIQYGYRDLCGNIYTNSFILQQPQQKNLLVSYLETSTLTDCESVAAYFNIRYQRTTAPIQTLYHQFKNSHNFRYSLDTGATWTNARAASTLNNASDYFTVKRGTSRLLMVAYCGDTLTTVLTPPALPTLSSGLSEVNTNSCISRTGISVSRGNAVGDTIGIQMTSAPAGQSLIPYFTSPPTNAVWQLSNILPGTYTIRIWDTFGVVCPRFIDRTITLTRPFALDFTIESNCNSSVNVISGNVTTSGALGSSLRVKVYSTSGTLLLGGTNGYTGTASGTATTVQLPATAVAGLPDGNYIIRAYKYTSTAYAPMLDTCTVVERQWVKQPNMLNLAASKFLPGCPGNTGSIVAVAQGGKAPYHYKVFDAANNEIPGSATGSNIFNNLNANATYTIQVIDTCGTIVNRTISVGEDLAIFVRDAATMPCPGDNVTLFVDSMQNVQYKWYKNNALLPGQNQYRLQLNNITAADSGAYNAEVIIGNCVMMINSFVLNPAACGTPLPVQLARFTAYNENGKGKLEWETLSESGNKGFEIERSTDAANWSKIGFVASKATAGNSIEKKEYTYTDNNISADAYFYRLKQINYNGQYTHSSVRKVAFKAVSEVSIYPNPAKENAVTVNGINGSHTINLYNMAGQLVRSVAVNGMSAVLDLKGFAPGVYQVNVLYKNGLVVNKRLVKQ